MKKQVDFICNNDAAIINTIKLKKLSLFATLLFGFFAFASAQTKELEKLISQLPDVQFKKIEPPTNFECAYEIKIKQPLNHSDTLAGFFYQKVFLSHKGFKRPMVMVTEGYNRKKNTICELSELLNANQISIEHRYFGESLPDSLNYDYLNLKQASADLHHINQLFQKIYAKKWISTGISKGGTTTIFYRYFYPNDVDLSVPYVAPINNAYEDQRIYAFLDTIGSAECREKLKAVQIRLLENREEILRRLVLNNKESDASYTYLTIEEAFEYAVLEFPFSFWQYGHSCNAIPNAKDSLEALVIYFERVSSITFFSDEIIELYGPHYYQSATEMGYYGYQTKGFEKLLAAIPTTSNPHATFLPNKMKAPFSGDLLRNINSWLQTEDNAFIYIYGSIDTWSATAVPPIKKDHSIWFFMEGKHHGNARINHMTEVEKIKLITTIEQWLSLKINDNLPANK